MSDGGKIILVLEGRVLPGKRQAMEAFVIEARPFYESIGDVAMRFMWDSKDEHRFREIFEYRSSQAFEVDDQRVKNDPEMHLYLGRWRTLLDGEISVSVWNEMAIR